MLLWELIKAFTEDNKQNKTDNCLEEWQKDLVQKCQYDYWNFEESEEKEDDDYYSEDEN